MLKKTKILIVSGIAVLTLSTAAFAWNHNGYGPGNRGGCAGMMNGNPAVMQNMTLEQRTAFQNIMKTYQTDNFQLRQDMWGKQVELQALSNAANPDSKKIAAVVEDLKSLRTKMFNNRQALQDKISKEVGPQFANLGGYGMGDMNGGMGGRGKGHRGMGKRGMNQGYGMGPGMGQQIQ